MISDSAATFMSCDVSRLHNLSVLLKSDRQWDRPLLHVACPVLK